MNDANEKAGVRIYGWYIGRWRLGEEKGDEAAVMKTLQ